MPEIAMSKASPKVFPCWTQWNHERYYCRCRTVPDDRISGFWDVLRNDHWDCAKEKEKGASESQLRISCEAWVYSMSKKVLYTVSDHIGPNSFQSYNKLLPYATSECPSRSLRLDSRHPYFLRSTCKLHSQAPALCHHQGLLKLMLKLSQKEQHGANILW